jgi:4-amino-4-deoxy-L-arabinose transferase-like glycosyltransferase
MSELKTMRETSASGFVVALLFVVTVAWFWGGVAPNDSDKYVRAAITWLTSGPSLGADHWALRLPIVAPVAASFSLFGVSEFVSCLPNILYAGGLVAVTFFFARRHMGRSAGTAAAILVATSSFFVVTQIELTVVGPEIFFLALGCWLFIEGTGDKIDLPLLFAAGACGGAAWLCREIAIFLPAALTLVLLMRRPLRIDAIVAVAAGFALILAAELAAYWLAAGDPLYRLKVDFGHRGPADFYALPDSAQSNSIFRRLLLPFKYLQNAPAITPFVAIAAAVWLLPMMRRAALAGKSRAVVTVFGVASIASFVVSAYVANVKAPVYYPIVSYAALLSIGAFVGGVGDQGRPRTALALLTAFVALNWATADFRRYDEYAESRYLARYIAKSGETVTTDQRTAVRTRLFLTLAGLDRDEAARLVLSADQTGPLCGLVFVATPKGATPAIAAAPDWRPLWSATVRKERLTEKLVRALSPRGAISPAVKNRLKIAGPVALYEAPPCR